MFKLNAGNRQYLNLSTYADGVLQNDMTSFAAGQSRSGFLNRVIRRYFSRADATISLRLAERKEQLEALFAGLPLQEGAEGAREGMVDMLLSEYAQTLLEKTRHPKDVNVGWDFRVDDENAWWIYRSGKLAEEEKCYKRGSDYVKALLEEYARLPMIRREAVYYNEEIREIERLIRDRQMLKITTSGLVFEVRAYGILADEQDRYHYLVGYSRPYHSEEQEVIASFRLSRIDHRQTRGMSRNNNRSGYLKKSQRKAVEEAIHYKGVMYLLDPQKAVYLRLGKPGLERYDKKQSSRPLLERPEERSPYSGREDVYKCFGTKRQIENYFFDFGEDVEILAPAELRDTFARRYREAAELYR